MAERSRPDLVIVDMMMPKKSGFLVLEGLKSKGAGPKVIMMTANEGSRHRAYAEMLGADDYPAQAPSPWTSSSTASISTARCKARS